MLPDFPTVKARRFELHKYIAHNLAIKRHGLLSKLQTRAIPEGNDWSGVSIDGHFESGGFEVLSASGDISHDEVPGLDDAQWIRKLLTDTFIPLADQQVDMFLRKLNEVTAATGNVVDASGGEFSEDLILELMEKMPLSFDQQGEPQMPTVLVGEKLFEKIRAMEPSNEFKTRQQQLVNQKRLEWRSDQADRQLVD